uniref:PLD phosphodiesterase domain-containing protein n=1 Tax=Ananas comosus var. bracteatus TaxID=296719 RepID=A0A6V7PXL7_ANACO|nr:unnamed protein product [Ananas comosus var. bracteatus]
MAQSVWPPNRSPRNTTEQRSMSGEDRGGSDLRRPATSQPGSYVMDLGGGIFETGQRAAIGGGILEATLKEARLPRSKFVQATANPKKRSTSPEMHREEALGESTFHSLFRSSSPSFTTGWMPREADIFKVGVEPKVTSGLGQSLGVTLVLAEKSTRRLMMGGGGHVKMYIRDDSIALVNGLNVDSNGWARDWTLVFGPCGQLMARGMTPSGVFHQVTFFGLCGMSELRCGGHRELSGGGLSLEIGENRNGVDLEGSVIQAPKHFEIGSPPDLDSDFGKKIGGDDGSLDMSCVLVPKPIVAAVNPNPPRDHKELVRYMLAQEKEEGGVLWPYAYA